MTCLTNETRKRKKKKSEWRLIGIKQTCVEAVSWLFHAVH
jgi:hypothetical protein